MSANPVWTRNLAGQTAVVIGAGVAGMSAAIALALRGAQVQVLERREFAGGRLGRITRGEYAWDLGPSIIHYPQAFTKLWSQAGLRFSDFVDMRPVDPIYRAVFGEGEAIDVWTDPERLRDEVARLDAGDADRLSKFIRKSGATRREIEERHLLRPRRTWRQPDPGRAAVDIQDSYLGALRRQFRHPTTIALLAHAAWWLGFPATSMVPAMRFVAASEWKHECWYPVDGMPGLVAAFVRLAELSKVAIRTNCEVENVRCESPTRMVVTGSGFEPVAAGIVVSTLDPLLTLEGLLEESGAPSSLKRRLAARRPGFSNLVVLAGARKRWPGLRHRTVCFGPLGVEEEMRMIGGWGTPCSVPTVDVMWTGALGSPSAPEGKSALVLRAMAPPVNGAWKWSDSVTADHRQRMIDHVEKHLLGGLMKHLDAEVTLTPTHFRDEYLLPDGDLHGPGFGGRHGAIVKAPNRFPELPGFYFAGASAHPGPLVSWMCLSGMHAAECAARDIG